MNTAPLRYARTKPSWAVRKGLQFHRFRQGMVSDAG
jgi:hypothetical protein